ncbi:MAG: serine--tRNA ligase [Acidimicrobiales bacterium]
MIDVHLAREEPDRLRTALRRKGADAAFDEFLAVDRAWRLEAATVERLRAATKPKGRPDEAARAAIRAAKEELRAAENTLARTAATRGGLLARIPNPPDPSVPDGTSDEDAVELRKVGEPRRFAFPPRDHLALGCFAVEKAAQLSGARFAYRIGDVALVELALYRYALDRAMAHGFTPVLPPVLVRESAMFGTGFLPTDETNLYRVEPDGLYLTGTSEVALAGLHAGEILDEDSLPRRYAGYSTCFRREAGAAGKDTRGIFRVHQFDKVEMFVYATPEESAAEHEAILAVEEEIIGGLGLAYRVVNVAAGDLGPSAAKKYDIEGWIPSQARYRELTSCSNTTDYQARRLNIRVRDDSGLRTLHTLNGTAITARSLIALLETFQEPDGSVDVPEVLAPFGAPARLAPPG